jgi:hypothetical protein
MIIVNEDKSISVTRGDAVTFTVSADIDGEKRLFEPGDVVCIKVYEKKNAENVVLQKYFPVVYEQEYLPIYLSSKDTKIGGLISKAVDYWYEIELNPFTDPQTIVGYDEDGPKVFKLFPEGAEVEEEEITEEDIPVVDAELDLTSTRPVQNQAIARELAHLNTKLDGKVDKTDGLLTSVNVTDGEGDLENLGIDCRRLGDLVVFQFHIYSIYNPDNEKNYLFYLPTPEHDISFVCADKNGDMHTLHLTALNGELYCENAEFEMEGVISYFTNEPLMG